MSFRSLGTVAWPLRVCTSKKRRTPRPLIWRCSERGGRGADAGSSGLEGGGRVGCVSGLVTGVLVCCDGKGGAVA
eukprot:358726-Chlamydomonas_euryale.AAC.6